MISWLFEGLEGTKLNDWTERKESRDLSVRVPESMRIIHSFLQSWLLHALCKNWNGQE